MPDITPAELYDALDAIADDAAAEYAERGNA